LILDNICFGARTDESIDCIIRAFSTLGKDRGLICPLTYGMYQTRANINDVRVVRRDIDTRNGFALRSGEIAEALSNEAIE
jgi:histidinol-phosphate/aromatic aminotransferase/cobyric acid decarboxylase-like protein